MNSSPIITPECHLLYPALFEPEAFGDAEPAYKALLLFYPGEDLGALQQKIIETARTRFPKKPPHWFTSGLRNPLRNGDEKCFDKEGNPVADSIYKGRMFMNVKTQFRPPVINQFGDAITDPDEIYGGIRVRAYVVFFPYEYAGNQGVSARLQAVIKTGDDRPLGGQKVDPAAAFKDFIVERGTIFEQDITY